MLIDKIKLLRESELTDKLCEVLAELQVDNDFCADIEAVYDMVIDYKSSLQYLAAELSKERKTGLLIKQVMISPLEKQQTVAENALMLMDQIKLLRENF